MNEIDVELLIFSSKVWTRIARLILVVMGWVRVVGERLGNVVSACLQKSDEDLESARAIIIDIAVRSGDARRVMRDSKGRS